MLRSVVVTDFDKYSVVPRANLQEDILKFVTVLLIAAGWMPLLSFAEDDMDRAISVISKVGAGATGSPEARIARDQLAQQGPNILPRLLLAMDSTNVVAANWYRTAFDEILDRELSKPTPSLPRAAIEEYVRDARRNGRPRRLALSALERLNPAIRGQLLAGWLDDVEFRRDAVDEVLKLGDVAKSERRDDAAREFYERGFRHARDSDQVLLAVSKLNSVGKEVDPIAHLGFVTRWRLMGPFPAEQMTGFRAQFPPEKQVDLSTDYQNSEGQILRWKLHQTSNSLGEVNLIQAIGAVREAVGYAYAELESPREQPVQLRCSADDNLSVWLNGEQVLAREQWLNGTRLDRFVTSVTLRPGINRVLVKICQGPQHVNPEVPNNWTFQLRFCDETGGAADVRNKLPAIEKETQK